MNECQKLRNLLPNHSAKCKKNLLTILVEDYFHVGAFENLIQQRNWAEFRAALRAEHAENARSARPLQHQSDVLCPRLDRRSESGSDPRDRRARSRGCEPRILSPQPEKSDAGRISRRPSPHKSGDRGRLRAKSRRLSGG